eukprot:scpid43078/ scgid0495/ 
MSSGLPEIQTTLPSRPTSPDHASVPARVEVHRDQTPTDDANGGDASVTLLDVPSTSLLSDTLGSIASDARVSITSENAPLAKALYTWGSKDRARSRSLGAGTGEISALDSVRLGELVGENGASSPNVEVIIPGEDERLSVLRQIRNSVQGLINRLLFGDSADVSRDTIKNMLAEELQGRAHIHTSDFDGPDDRYLRKQIRKCQAFSGLNERQAKLTARVKRLIHKTGSREKAVNHVLKHCPTEDEAQELVRSLISQGVDLQSTHDDTGGPIHLSTKRGFKKVTSALIENEVPIDWKNARGQYALEVAIDMRDDDIAELLLRAMNRDAVRSLFIPADLKSKPKINFYDVAASCTSLKKTCTAVLDSMIEETDRSDDFVINYAPLELTADGCVPHSEDYVWGSPTAYHKVCQSRDLRHHCVTRLLTYRKWTGYAGLSSSVNIFAYLVFLLLLSFAAMSAGIQRVSTFNATTGELGDPRVYDDTKAVVRAICEILLLLTAMYTLYDEVQEMRSLGLSAYCGIVYNYYQLFMVTLLLAIVPLRWLDIDLQWYFLSILYMLAFLRLLQLLSNTRFVGIYTRILTHILKSDVTRFVALFIIFWLTFTGSFFLVLVGSRRPESMETGTQLDISEETRYYVVSQGTVE